LNPNARSTEVEASSLAEDFETSLVESLSEKKMVCYENSGSGST